MNDGSAVDSGEKNAGLDQGTDFLLAVMRTWEARVNAEVPNTAKLNASILVGALPLVYEKLRESASGMDVASASGWSTLGLAHGRERALMTEYRPCDLIHELQIFRDVVLAAFEDAAIVLDGRQLALISSIVDEISRDSLNGFNDVREQARHLFSSAVSRDVRNVFNVISVTAQLMEQKARDPNVAAMAKRITAKISEADTMLMSVSSDQSLNRNLKLKLTIGPVTLLPLIENVCIDFQDATGRIMIHSDPIEGYWSWAAMESALRNLINYARCAGATSNDLRVSACVAFGRLLLSLHTKGVFLDSADFETRSDRSEHEHTGQLTSGPGLAYAQNVAESHGGSLIVRSSATAGTTVTMNIPLDARPHAES